MGSKFWGTPEEVLDPVDKHVRNKKEHKVCVYSYFTIMIFVYFV